MSASSDKLAQSRLAIMEHVNRKDRRSERPERPDAGEPGNEPGESEAKAAARTGWVANLSDAGKSWWRRHPASMALELATPSLASFARRHPFQFLGGAAVLGAVVLVARPWKLISVTGVLVAVLKSSEITGLVMSAISPANHPNGEQQPPS